MRLWEVLSTLGFEPMYPNCPGLQMYRGSFVVGNTFQQKTGCYIHYGKNRNMFLPYTLRCVVKQEDILPLEKEIKHFIVSSELD